MALTKLQGQLIDATTSATTTDLAYTGTLTGGTGIVNIGSGQIYKKADGSIGIGTTEPNLYSYNFAGDYRGNFYSLVATNQGATNTNAYLNLVSLASGASSIIFGNETTERGSLYVNSNSTLALSTRDSGTGFLTDRLTINNSGAATLTGSLSVNGNTTLGDAAGDTLTINAGTTTFAQGTANGVLYLNGSKVATSGSGLVFDGESLGIGASPGFYQGSGLFITRNGFATIRLNDSSAGGRAAEIKQSDSTGLILESVSNVPIQFNVNASETARLTSKGLLVDYTSDSGLSGTGNAIFSGNVGIGTSSPTEKLDVNGAIAIGGTKFFSKITGDSYIWNNTSALNFVSSDGNTVQMKLDSSGNLGLGVTPSGPYHFQTSTSLDNVARFNSTNSRGPIITLSRSGTQTCGFGSYSAISGSGTDYTPVIFAETGLGISFIVNGNISKAMTLDSSGNLIVGTTSGYKKVTVNGSVYATDLGSFYAANGAAGSTDQFSDRVNNSGDSFYTRFIHTTSGGWTGYCAQYVGDTRTGQYYPFRYLDNSFNSLFYVDVNGNLYATSITETSSIRYKENIAPISNGLEKINNLVGVTYTRKDSNKEEAGLIAEDVYGVLPLLVSKNDDGEIEGVHYTKITAYLIEAVKELTKQIEELKNGRNL